MLKNHLLEASSLKGLHRLECLCVIFSCSLPSMGVCRAFSCLQSLPLWAEPFDQAGPLSVLSLSRLQSLLLFSALLSIFKKMVKLLIF